MGRAAAKSIPEFHKHCNIWACPCSMKRSCPLRRSDAVHGACRSRAMWNSWPNSSHKIAVPGASPSLQWFEGDRNLAPCALGHRSLLAVPDSYEIKRRLNRLKFRQWFRPVAPMIAVEALEEVFGRVVLSTSTCAQVRAGSISRAGALRWHCAAPVGEQGR